MTRTSRRKDRERAGDLDAIVRDGVCIGCGLCAGISGGAVEMAFTAEQKERPRTLRPLAPAIMESVRATCPGVIAEGLSAEEAGDGATLDPVWGWMRRNALAWAADPEVRFEGSAGGALNALAIHLLESGAVDFILHVGADPNRPARSHWRISRNATEVRGSGGSRYGPAAPLAGLDAARADGGRFAFIGKPCDVSAIRLLAKREDWLAERCRFRLTLMCGGASNFSKTADLLAGWNMEESDLVELRYRGRGNPGPTTAATSDGRSAETTYQALWEDESAWALQHRCKICPDAIGMAADIVAFDCWPGGGPVGEDEGFNAVIARSPAGERLLSEAEAAGALTLGRAVTADDIEDWQPHQSRKRRAVWARLAGQRAAGRLAPQTSELRIEALARAQPRPALLSQARGTRRRVAEGRADETPHG